MHFCSIARRVLYSQPRAGNQPMHRLAYRETHSIMFSPVQNTRVLWLLISRNSQKYLEFTWDATRNCVNKRRKFMQQFETLLSLQLQLQSYNHRLQCIKMFID